MQMRYRGMIKLVPICSIWLALAVVALAIVESPSQPTSIIINVLICIGVTLFAFRISAEIFFKVIKLNKQRIEFSRAWGKPAKYEWRDVESVNFNKIWQAFEITFRDGRQLKVSLTMDNLRSFLQLLSQQLPREKYLQAIEQFAGTFGGGNHKDDD